MIKKVLVGSLVVVVILAAAFSIYNINFASAKGQTVDTAGTIKGGGYGNNNGNGARGQRSNGDGTGVPAPQNGMSEWVDYSGKVSAFDGQRFNLLTSDGQSIPAELGSLNYVAELGIVLQEGDLVDVTGFWDANGGLALRSLTLVDTEVTYEFRDELARPLWAGPKGNGQ